MKPISPSECAKQQMNNLPDQVIACWNRVIAEHFNGRSSTFKQDEIVQALMDEMKVTRERVFANQSWLNVEPLYEVAGWMVEYDRPAYNESYPATFRFTSKWARA